MFESSRNESNDVSDPQADQSSFTTPQTGKEIVQQALSFVGVRAGLLPLSNNLDTLFRNRPDGASIEELKRARENMSREIARFVQIICMLEEELLCQSVATFAQAKNVTGLVRQVNDLIKLSHEEL